MFGLSFCAGCFLFFCSENAHARHFSCHILFASPPSRLDWLEIGPREHIPGPGPKHITILAYPDLAPEVQRPGIHLSHPVTTPLPTQCAILRPPSKHLC
ncbi:hypothetical protein L228DRAFT_243409 [Xylona heveae TC161]|uniref:Secreted protein n=1 Tax=Xylona heveae (strain CBS 132557 / TC161) TaxID=1328760 RepID=A0A161TL63_XYLHT|nr:hypothetical protein L228DRAFT_243409 [Xylona heveae TC161]KZF26880.1 hypothetical protein L228DRAFT_243409 [Xylona heveae TC161]